MLRSTKPELRIVVDAGPGNFGRKLRNADRSGALTALILGDNEISTNRVGIKYLRESVDQLSVPQTDFLADPDKYLAAPVVRS